MVIAMLCKVITITESNELLDQFVYAPCEISNKDNTWTFFMFLPRGSKFEIEEDLCIWIMFVKATQNWM